MDTTDTTDAQPPEEPQRTPRRGIARPPRVRRPTATADATPNDAPLLRKPTRTTASLLSPKPTASLL